MEDTSYFEEVCNISDWIDSAESETSELEPMPAAPLVASRTREALSQLPLAVQDWAIDAIETPYNSARLHALDNDIDSMLGLLPGQCVLLKRFIRAFGKRERKPPRDELLRDRNTRAVVLDVRKKTAFLGYSWRRMRPPRPVRVGLGIRNNINAANRHAGGPAVFGGGDGVLEGAWGGLDGGYYRASRGNVVGLARGRFHRW